ncbi:MAG: preprotein translocase subunit YajC [Dehalococcoidia bacterium]|jgi:preprotein translocase subunit YajC
MFESWGMIIILIALFALMYFFMIRPRQKQQKEQEEMKEHLKSGDRVITAGGIYGQIESLGEETVILRIESGATMKVAKGSILGKQDVEEQGRGVF